jgi:Fic family protein
MTAYIYELPDWPNFNWNQEKLANQLIAVRHRQGRLIGRMQALGFPLQEEAVLKTLTEDVLKSSEIEGEILDKDQVRSSIARRLGIDAGALPPANRNVEGVVEMMLDATQRFDEPLSAARLFGWHGALFPTGRSGLSKIKVAQWRDKESGPMRVVSGAYGREQVHSEAPAADRLDDEMQRFLTWFNLEDKLDPVIKSRARASVVYHHSSIRRRQRSHRTCDRRHVACAVGRQPTTLLQHVGANPAGAECLLRHARSDSER